MNKKKQEILNAAERERQRLKERCRKRREDAYLDPVPKEKDLQNVSQKDLIALTRVRKRSKRGRPPTVKGKIDGKTWDYKSRVTAVTAYLATGSNTEAAAVIGASEGTIRNWRKAQWWNEIAFEIKQRKNDELDAKLSKIIDKVADTIEDRLENGEAHYDTRNGTIVRVPVKMKDAAVVGAIGFDKRQLLRGDVTSRTETVSTDQRLQSLAEQFKGFATGETIEAEEADFEEIEDIEDYEEDAHEQEEQEENPYEEERE